MSNYGYVKLYRKSLVSAVFQSEKVWKVWCYCLMRANHQRTCILWEGREMELEPGQFITGRFEAARDCAMKPSTLWYQIRKLHEMRNIDITSDNRHSLITIKKWAQYQSTTVSYDNHIDKRLTTIGQQIGTDKKGENENKERNKHTPSENMMRIFHHWNSKNIRSHRTPTAEMERAFHKSGMSEAEAIQAINNYAVVLNDPESFFSYRWTLEDFLKRKNAGKRFVDSEVLQQFKIRTKPSVTYRAEEI